MRGSESPRGGGGGGVGAGRRPKMSLRRDILFGVSAAGAAALRRYCCAAFGVGSVVSVASIPAITIRQSPTTNAVTATLSTIGANLCGEPELDPLPPRAAQDVAWLANEAGVPPNAVRAALDELVRRELVEPVGGRWQRPQRA